MPGWIDAMCALHGSSAGIEKMRAQTALLRKMPIDQPLSQEQLNAACDETKKQGLRTLMHAYREAVRAATLVGCTEIEHGTLATDDDLKLMAERSTYLNPQAGLVIENYLLNARRLRPQFRGRSHRTTMW